ncbi:O-antigen ligase family protein [Candidatus Thioglobus sp.]|nr:O-antigen ligase family protein [Candidatus Thioglobus sp.]
MIGSFNLEKTYQYLLIILAFLIPLTVAVANFIIVIICLLWIFSGNYKTKFAQIIRSRLIIASIFFYFIHVIGMLWTEDLIWGLHMLHKMWYFLLLFPILFTIVQKNYIKYYVISFLLAIALTEIVSYLVWFEIVDPFKNATVENPTPFMSHVSYNPILIFAIYLVLHEIFLNNKLSNFLFTFYGFFAISMTINMFITGGRAGQVGFFVMISILIFQIFEKQRIQSLMIILLVIPSIFFAAYQSSDLFSKRVDTALIEAFSYSDEADTNDTFNSVGLRINFTLNSFELIGSNLITGVGTGDFPTEYKKINQINTPQLPNTTNPHNMYTLITAQLGLIGLFSMLSIFYYQIKLSFSASNKFIKDFGLTLPLVFLVIMLSDSYLLGHFTTLVFVFFSSFLYNDFEKS